jgi:hypothetical protein
MQPRVTDDDGDQITVSLDGRELRRWIYASEGERRQKIVQAREYVEGWCDGRTTLAIFDILNPVALAVENLACHQEQCDQDGVMVKVSRQALDEVLEAINQLAIAAAQDSLAYGARAVKP